MAYSASRETQPTPSRTRRFGASGTSGLNRLLQRFGRGSGNSGHNRSQIAPLNFGEKLAGSKVWRRTPFHVGKGSKGKKSHRIGHLWFFFPAPRLEKLVRRCGSSFITSGQPETWICAGFCGSGTAEGEENKKNRSPLSKRRRGAGRMTRFYPAGRWLRRENSGRRMCVWPTPFFFHTQMGWPGRGESFRKKLRRALFGKGLPKLVNICATWAGRIWAAKRAVVFVILR